MADAQIMLEFSDWNAPMRAFIPSIPAPILNVTSIDPINADFTQETYSFSFTLALYSGDSEDQLMNPTTLAFVNDSVPGALTLVFTNASRADIVTALNAFTFIPSLVVNNTRSMSISVGTVSPILINRNTYASNSMNFDVVVQYFFGTVVIDMDTVASITLDSTVDSVTDVTVLSITGLQNQVSQNSTQPTSHYQIVNVTITSSCAGDQVHFSTGFVPDEHSAYITPMASPNLGIHIEFYGASSADVVAVLQALKFDFYVVGTRTVTISTPFGTSYMAVHYPGDQPFNTNSVGRMVSVTRTPVYVLLELPSSNDITFTCNISAPLFGTHGITMIDHDNGPSSYDLVLDIVIDGMGTMFSDSWLKQATTNITITMIDTFHMRLTASNSTTGQISDILSSMYVSRSFDSQVSMTVSLTCLDGSIILQKGNSVSNVLTYTLNFTNGLLGFVHIDQPIPLVLSGPRVLAGPNALFVSMVDPAPETAMTITIEPFYAPWDTIDLPDVSVESLSYANTVATIIVEPVLMDSLVNLLQITMNSRFSGVKTCQISVDNPLVGLTVSSTQPVTFSNVVNISWTMPGISYDLFMMERDQHANESTDLISTAIENLMQPEAVSAYMDLVGNQMTLDSSTEFERKVGILSTTQAITASEVAVRDVLTSVDERSKTADAKITEALATVDEQSKAMDEKSHATDEQTKATLSTVEEVAARAIAAAVRAEAAVSPKPWHQSAWGLVTLTTLGLLLISCVVVIWILVARNRK